MHARARTILLFLLDVFLNVVAIVVLVVVIRFYIVSPFQVSGPSMCDTFNNFEGQCLHGNGEYIMIYKLGWQNILGWQVGLPERGDVVVFRPPMDETNDYFIKRVIGLPGETVDIRNGYVTITNETFPEGFQLDESNYLNSVNLGHTETNGDLSHFEVPDEHYFVLGDNRRVSSDGRRCFEQTGCNDTNTPYITMDLIQGRAWVVLWPFNRMRFIGRGVSFGW